MYETVTATGGKNNILIPTTQVSTFLSFSTNPWICGALLMSASYQPDLSARSRERCGSEVQQQSTQSLVWTDYVDHVTPVNQSCGAHFADTIEANEDGNSSPQRYGSEPEHYWICAQETCCRVGKVAVCGLWIWLINTLNCNPSP